MRYSLMATVVKVDEEGRYYSTANECFIDLATDTDLSESAALFAAALEAKLLELETEGGLKTSQRCP